MSVGISEMITADSEEHYLKQFIHRSFLTEMVQYVLKRWQQTEHLFTYVTR